MANEKQLNAPNLDALVNAGSNAQTAAKPESAPIDLSSVGGKVVASPPTGSSKPVDLSSCYGETGRALDETSIEQRFRDAGVYGEFGGLLGTSPTAGGEPVDLSSLYGERGGFLQTQTTADEPTKE